MSTVKEAPLRALTKEATNPEKTLEGSISRWLALIAERVRGIVSSTHRGIRISMREATR
jgi:hypothetical protein